MTQVTKEMIEFSEKPDLRAVVCLLFGGDLGMIAF